MSFIWGWPVYFKLFSGIAGLYPPGAKSFPSPGRDNGNRFQMLQMPLGVCMGVGGGVGVGVCEKIHSG